MDEGLIERLRQTEPYTINGRGTGLPDKLINPNGPEAATTLSRIREIVREGCE